MPVPALTRSACDARSTALQVQTLFAQHAVQVSLTPGERRMVDGAVNTANTGAGHTADELAVDAASFEQLM
jgi:hypothetical protein